MAHVLLMRLQFSTQALLVVPQVDLFLILLTETGDVLGIVQHLVYDVIGLIKIKCSCSY